MPGSNDIRIRIRLGPGTWWSILLGLAFALAIGTAVVVVAASLFIVLIPVTVIAAAVLYLFGRAQLRSARSGLARDASILDADFHAVTPGKLESESSADEPPRSGSPH